MPGYLTDFANNKLLDLIFGASAVTPSASLYIGLSQTPAIKSGAVAEPSGGGYARAAVANDPAHFAAAQSGTKTNTLPITFASPTGDWGAILSVFVADSPSGGNVIAIADLPAPRSVSAGGGAPSIAAGALFLSHT